MGVRIASGPEEEDVSSEEASKISRRESIAGCHSIEQMLSLWECEESAFIMSVLCQWSVTEC